METRKVDGTTRRCMTGAICHAAGASEVEIGSNPIIDEAIQIVSSLSRTDRMHRYRLSMFALQLNAKTACLILNVLPLEHVRVAT